MRTYSLTQFPLPLLHLKCTSRYFGRTVLPHQVVSICTDCGLWKLHVTLHLKRTHGISVLLSLKQFLLKNAVSRSLVRCQSVTMNWLLWCGHMVTYQNSMRIFKVGDITKIDCIYISKLLASSLTVVWYINIIQFSSPNHISYFLRKEKIMSACLCICPPHVWNSLLVLDET
jgi:hypothetical protein